MQNSSLFRWGNQWWSGLLPLNGPFPLQINVFALPFFGRLTIGIIFWALESRINKFAGCEKKGRTMFAKWIRHKNKERSKKVDENLPRHSLSLSHTHSYLSFSLDKMNNNATILIIKHGRNGGFSRSRNYSTKTGFKQWLDHSHCRGGGGGGGGEGDEELNFCINY